MIKVWDGFLYSGENQMLEMRMEILDPFVDFFVITEGSLSFSGKNKELKFPSSRDRFSKFEKKIIYNPVLDTPMGNESWDRERFQRNAIIRGFKDCSDSDIVLTGDVDEIPRLDYLGEFYKPETLFHPMQNFYYYKLNLLVQRGWFGSKICNYGYLRKFGVDPLRNMKDIGYSITEHGWHFSYFGGAEVIRQKIESFSDMQFNNDFIKDHIEENVKNNRDLFYRPYMKFEIVPIDESYPLYIRENLDKYKDYIA